MPLLVVYGKPCSGKTKTVNDFIHYLKEKLSISDDKIKVICDTDNTEFSTNIYDNAKLVSYLKKILF